ncbi:MAG: FAD-binding oxidoreductase [Acinetobacter populi]|jgi:FAD/FMN-containing dehydrogenase|uniref:FAD-binding oxidoreductase n=1 Tax=Acinetobacter populi TaxID=1582270 RepID=UPI0023579026|nr:FAD-binding oxidoreductase [Acinetobacter populi]MCH4247721.1 FAD-binding oxidoreductase [Acinetobacter populi]
MNLSEKINHLITTLPELKWDTSEIRKKQTSSDFHWFSPILKQQLAHIQVDAVVCPRNIEELKTLIHHAVHDQIPLTVRGGGTGNYGQSLPLHGGIVIDFTAFNQILSFDQSNAVVHAQAGIRLKVLEDYCIEQGYELRCKPSTFKIATLGGFFAGGFGGIGSINYGPLNAIGNILSLRLLTIEEQPKIIELNALQAAEYAHSYGTTGIVLDFHLSLAPHLNWHECVLTFPKFAQAFQCAEMIANDPALGKKEIAVFSAGIERYYDHLKAYIQPGDATILSIIEHKYLNTLQCIVEKFQGKICFRQTRQQAEQSKFSILDYCWNHATLAVLKHDKNFTYLQTSYSIGSELSQLEKITEKCGSDQIIQHVEMIRNAHGQVACSGLPILAYQNPQQLQQIMKYHEEAGVRINDPHTIYVADGHHSKQLNPNIIIYKQQNDPHHLLNIGKLSSSI